jgi:hypothetical protein
VDINLWGINTWISKKNQDINWWGINWWNNRKMVIQLGGGENLRGH